MDERLENLINILKKERIKKEYSMRALAKECGFNHSYIFDLEHSFSNKIDLIKLLKICEVLDVDFYELLIESGLIFSDKEFQCYEIDVYLDDELFYKFDVSESTEERAIDLLENYLYQRNLINDDMDVCYEIEKKIPKGKRK